MRGVTTRRKVGKRIRRFNLNLTEMEHKGLLSEAKKSGFTPQDYVRSLLACKPFPAVNLAETEVQEKDGPEPERRSTREQLAFKKRSLDIELKSKEKELEVWEEMVELQNLKLELMLMELEKEKERMAEELYYKKITKRITDNICKH